MPGGRPTKLTPEIQHRVVQALGSGNTRTASAAFARIGLSTFERWLTDPRPKYQEFRAAVEKAEADAEVRNVAIIQKAAPETWQAAAWWLERRRPQDWARTERLDLKHAGKVEVEHGVDVAGANALLAALGYGPLGATEPGDASASPDGDSASTPD